MRPIGLVVATVGLIGLAGCDKVFGLERDPPAPDAPPPAASWLRVDLGAYSACGIQGDHTLWCWGRNDFGQLGAVENGADLESDRPRRVGAREDWQQVSVGALTVCAIAGDHTLWCWGRNDLGQTGTGATAVAVLEPTMVMGAWKSVAVGVTHACAIDQNAQVWCWGHGYYGALGLGTYDDQPTPVMVPVAGPWSDVRTGSAHTCALKTSGEAWCWGDNDYGALGNAQAPGGLVNAPVRVDNPTPFSQLALGDALSCGVQTDGKMRCWGRADRGQLGNGSVDSSRTPVVVDQDLIADFTEVTAGDAHVCALHGDGRLVCWGANAYGQLAHDLGDAFRTVPQPNDDGGTFAHVVGGSNATCVVDAAGALSCAGFAAGGQLGDGTGSVTTPVEVAPATGTFNANGVSAGFANTCAIQGTTLRCWGDNGNGAVGDGTILDRQVPTIVTGDYDAVSASRSTCARHADRTIACWGANDYGQLGTGDTTERHVPISIPAYTWAGIQLNVHTTCGLSTSNSAVYCWGENLYGEANASPNNPPYETLPTIQGGSYQLFSTGGYHTCAIANGALWCWGYAQEGAVGVANAASDQNPKAVPTGGPVDAVTAGERHTCARAGTQVWCFGANAYGQLGDQTTTSTAALRPLPKQWLAVVAGAAHTCGVTTDHALWCWGANADGQLGTGDFAEHHEPVRVGMDTDWLAVWPAQIHTCAQKQDGRVFCWGGNTSGQLGNGLAWRAKLVGVGQ